jgi:hypothetical protein
MRNCDGKSHGARFGQSPKGGEAFSTPRMCDVFLLAAVALEVPLLDGIALACRF